MANKRSITDDEISLIKAMIERDMKNKDIQFFFNRPHRSVNSGRITGIRTGEYSNSAEITAASEETMEQFIASFEAAPLAVSISVPATNIASAGPTDIATLRSMFEQTEGGVWHFKHGESERYECKEGFRFSRASKWMRAIAALANNNGGYVLFGIKDSANQTTPALKGLFEVVGLATDEFSSADPVEFTKKLKAAFDPTPLASAASLVLDGKTVGIIHVQQHPSRPVIATKNEGDQIKEGDIFFRYPGQSSRIKYSDLRAILDDRDRHAREQILPMLSELMKLGPENAMIADISEGTLSDQDKTVVISEDLLDRIKFIKEGEFEEKSGAATLRVIGDAHVEDAEGVELRKGFATSTDLINDFLQQRVIRDPTEYIRCAVEACNGAWMPMHYFARQANLTREELIDFIQSTNAPDKTRNLFADRASSVISPHEEARGASEGDFEALDGGRVPEFSTYQRAAEFSRAVMGMTSSETVPLIDLLAGLSKALQLISDEKPTWKGVVRKAIARADELYFAA